MDKAPVTILCAVAFAMTAPAALGNTVIVNGFGVGGWSSWETRGTTGSLFIGTNDSSSSAVTYFNTPGSTGSDANIENQIIFMDPGKTLKAVGNQTLPVDPTGSLNGLGYVRLDGTSGNLGRSDLSYVDFQGIAAASVLDDANFTMSYRYYTQPYTTVAPALQLNIAIRGADGADYTLTYSASGATGWNAPTVTRDNGLFQLSKKGTGVVGGVPKSLDTWFHDSTFGSALFGTTANIYRVGFAEGVNQPNVVEYLDWVQTPFMNGGDVIDFTGPSARQASDSVSAGPLPSSAGMGCLVLGMAWGAKAFRRKWARGFGVA